MVRPLDGVLMEDKGSSIAVHYRLNPGIGPHLAERLDAIIAAGGGRSAPAAGPAGVRGEARQLRQGPGRCASSWEPRLRRTHPVFHGR